MSERPPIPVSKEVTPSQQEAEELVRFAAWNEEHPVPEIPQDSLDVCLERMATWDTLLTQFEQAHDLEVLHAITAFTSREERTTSVRQHALDALTPIVQLWKYLKTQEAVPTEQFDALFARYVLLKKAVGVIQEDPEGNIFELVVHTR